MKRLLGPLLFLPFSAQAGDEVTRLHAIFDREWERRLRESPTFATSVGRHEYDDKLGSVTPADLARRNEERKKTLTEIEAIDRAALPEAERVNYDIFKRQAVNGIESYELGDYQMPINADSGFHSGFSRLAKEMPLQATKDYENYISPLKEWPPFRGGDISLMRTGLKRGMRVARATLTGYDKSISAHVVDSPEKSVFWEPFAKFPSTVPASDHERLQREGRDAVMIAVSGYKKFLDFFDNEYLPGTRTTLGAYELPNGKKFYQLKIREFTTLDLTPEEIHKIGLSEVDRISK